MRHGLNCWLLGPKRGCWLGCAVPTYGVHGSATQRALASPNVAAVWASPGRAGSLSRSCLLATVGLPCQPRLSPRSSVWSLAGGAQSSGASTTRSCSPPRRFSYPKPPRPPRETRLREGRRCGFSPTAIIGPPSRTIKWWSGP